MEFRKQQREEVNVNLTPLIDVVFLLLIFFMVSTTFQKENHISLNLPEASNKEQQAVSKSIYVTISASGDLAVNARALVKNDAATLMLALQNLDINDKTIPFILSADAMAPHQSVVTVMDVAGKLGFSRLGIATTNLREHK